MLHNITTLEKDKIFLSGLLVKNLIFFEQILFLIISK